MTRFKLRLYGVIVGVYLGSALHWLGLPNRWLARRLHRQVEALLAHVDLHHVAGEVDPIIRPPAPPLIMGLRQLRAILSD